VTEGFFFKKKSKQANKHKEATGLENKKTPNLYS
jgi:hypothetical protein